MSRGAPEVTWLHLLQPERSQAVELTEEEEEEEEEQQDEEEEEEVQQSPQRIREELHQ